jgi:hypothetical protein
VDGAAHVFILWGKSAITRARSASLIDPQRAISSSVRPQPVQSLLEESITQTLMQGVWIMASSE